MRFTLLLAVVAIVSSGGCFHAAGEGPTIIVTAKYPGASAQVLVDTIAVPLEQQIMGVESMTRLYSESRNDGSYIAYVQFEPNVDEKLMQFLVQNRIGAAYAQLPDAVKQVGVTTKWQAGGHKQNRVAIAVVDRTGRGHDALRLFSAALAKRLSKEGAVLNPGLFPGADEKQVTVNLDRNKCHQHGIDDRSIFNAMQENEPTLQAVRNGSEKLDVLKTVNIHIKNGLDIPLSELADCKLIDGPAVLYRLDLYLAVRITGMPPQGTSAQAAALRCLEIAKAEQESQSGRGFKAINLTAP